MNNNKCLKQTTAKVRQFDQFSQSANFNFSQKTVCGSLLTCIVFIATMTFFVQSTLVLQARNGTLFTTSTLSNYNDFSRNFTQDDGFQVAFAVVDYQTDDWSDVAGRQLEEYLEIYVSAYYFSRSGEEFKTETLYIEHHPCSDVELGFDDNGESKFNPLIDEEKI